MFPAAWALRGFGLEGLLGLASDYRPAVLEVSKDFVDAGTNSLKELARGFDGLRSTYSTEIFLAGTTDLAGCAGFSWRRYRDYLAVQVAQARFLQCNGLRLFTGPRGQGLDERAVIDRLAAFCEDLAPMKACVEIHAGIESDLAILPELLLRAPIELVIDIEGMCNAGLTTAEVRALVPPERVAYLHVRNLPDVCVEDPATLGAQRECQQAYPREVVLWEPKTVEEPRRIRELFHEYRTAD